MLCPREPISSTDYMIGLHASTLIADGGSLQIGIGALGDAFVYASQLRHSDAALYQDILHKTAIAERFSNIINSVVGPVASLGALNKVCMPLQKCSPKGLFIFISPVF